MEYELYHWGIKKGEAAEKHKYVKREWKNNRWVYYYDTPGAKNKPTSQLPKTERKPASKPVSKPTPKPRQTVNTGLNKVNSILSSTSKASNGKSVESIKKRITEAKQLVESKIASVKDRDYKNLSIEAAVAPVEKEASKQVNNAPKNNNANEDVIIKKGANSTSLIEKRKAEAEQRKLEKQRKEEEAKALEKKEYDDAQNAERNGVRKAELEEALKMLNKEPTWFKKYNSLPELNLKNGATTLDEDMALVNPNYQTSEKDKYDQNCAVCTLAYDLRRRGYDIEASSEDVTMADGKTGLTMKEIAACYKGAEIVTMSDIGDKNPDATSAITDALSNEDGIKIGEHMDKELLSHGEGARGHAVFVWTKGGSHDIIWEVENGKVVYRDCQTNQKIKLEEYSSLSKDMLYMRTDNLQLTDEAMKYVRNRKG